jgi:predicted deacylase
VFAEGGSHGLLDPVEVEHHLRGLVGVLRALGSIEAPAPEAVPIELAGYRFLPAPASGWCRSLVRAGQWVTAGDPVAELADRYSAPIATLAAPASGYILWRVTHPIVASGDPIVGLGTPSS